MAFATRADGSCVHLGTHENHNACSIYEHRGTTCREFERGSQQCLEFRKELGRPAEPGPLAAQDLEHIRRTQRGEEQ